MTDKILVIGSGAWGTALANHLAQINSLVKIATRSKKIADEINSLHQNFKYLSDINLSKNLQAITDYNHDYDYVFIAPTSLGVIEVFDKISQKNFNEKCCFVICTKGMVDETLELFSQAFERIVNTKNYAVLSGPNFAIEVANSLPTITSIACNNYENYCKIAKILDNNNFKTIYTEAVEYAEICGVMKNIIAIGCGIADQLNFGANGKSALLLRGINEIKQICLALKIKEDLISPAGFGDIFLTCSSTKSRNFTLGTLLASTQKIPNDTTFEGLNALNIILKLAKKLKLKLELCEVIAKISKQELDSNQYKLMLINTILK